MHLAGLRGAGRHAVAANERLVETEIEAQQVLAEDGKTEHDEGKTDQPRQRADRPEGEAEQTDRRRRRIPPAVAGVMLASPGAASVWPGTLNCQTKRIRRADHGDDKGDQARDEQ